MEQRSTSRAAAPSSWLRAVPLLVLVAGLGAFFALGLQRYVTFEALAHHREGLLGWVGGHPLAAPAVYIAAYILAVAFSVPGGIWFTIAGGFLFGTALGGCYAVIGATLGATALFLAARSAAGDLLRARAGSALQRMEEGFRRDAFNYLLILRLVPLFPFFLVNLVPAFLGVPLRTYVAATAVGIIPAVFVFASVGNGLGAVFDAGGEKPHLLTPPVLVPLMGLAVLALIPVVYRAVKRRQGERGHHG
ncbi:MAG TPA: TVP38/TMEM64 family protein [Alphaproteobacteria bacterium]|nr:TVP38/TMEM64 family protein [Alphaproteobacteria bacterium]